MNKKTKRRLLHTCLSATIALSLTLTGIFTNAGLANGSSSVTRMGGTDQYETAAKIAEQGWKDTSDNVVLSSGIKNALVDALAAGPLGAKLKAPILLTDNGQELTPSAKAELLRLKPKKAYITSGTAVIKASVLEEIAKMGITPVSLGGYDQYETSVNIAKELIAQGANVTKIVVTAGWVAPVDALSVSSIAASLEIPILATTRDMLPLSLQSFLREHSGITESYIIGGTAVVGDAIARSLPGSVQRYSGMTKFDTNLEVLKGFADKVQYEKVYVANGETFVDALSGAALAALTRSPIVLSQSQWSLQMIDFLKLNKLQNVIALGGVVVVPEDVLQQLTLIANPSSNPPVIPPVITPVTPPVTPPVVPPVTPPSVPTAVNLSDLQVITDPSNSLGTFSNGALIDLSSLDNTVKVQGFGLIADQNCTLQFKVLDKIQNISLIAGEQRIVTVGDLITGGQVQVDGVELSAFRLLYATKTLTGQLLSNGNNVGTLRVTLKFK